MSSMNSTRKDQHKFTTPPWKETYKKRCLENMRKNRVSFLNRFRMPKRSDVISVVQEVMTEEWNVLRKSHTTLPSCSELMFDTDNEEITYLNSIVEEVELSLREEEKSLLELYFTDYEKDLCNTIDQLLSDSDLICPLCQRNPLMMNKGVVLCACGLRVNTEQDAVTISYIKQSLEQTMATHNNSCEETANFVVEDMFGTNHLLMVCEACDFMDIII